MKWICKKYFIYVVNVLPKNWQEDCETFYVGVSRQNKDNLEINESDNVNE